RLGEGEFPLGSRLAGGTRARRLALTFPSLRDGPPLSPRGEEGVVAVECNCLIRKLGRDLDGRSVPAMTLPGFAAAAVDRAAARAARLDVEEFHAAYCAVLDACRIEEWPRFFTEDAVYRITGRENADAGLPVGLVYCEGLGMIRDRAFAIAH